MTYQPPALESDPISLPKLPAWLTSQWGETAENVVFLSGASFAMLDMILRQERESIPKDLLANTLALKAAVATSKLEGRLAREADIRDAYHLTQPDVDGVRHWGPDGDVLDFWRRSVRLRFASRDWQAKLAELVGASIGDELSSWISHATDEARRMGPMAAAVNAIKDVLTVNDRAERRACFLSDAILAKALGWDRPLPLTAQHLTKAALRDLRKEGEAAYAAEMSVQSALLKSAQSAYRLAANLSSRADALRFIAPKLRAKGSEAAVDLFLTEEAVAPASMLSPMIRGTSISMTDRAARRLCDRLVELGVAKELTGRPTFRLYGIGA